MADFDRGWANAIRDAPSDVPAGFVDYDTVDGQDFLLAQTVRGEASPLHLIVSWTSLLTN